MIALNIVVIALLYQRIFASPHTLRENVASSDLLNVLSEITQRDELISLIWSQRVNNILKDEILQLFKEKMIFVRNNYGTMADTPIEGKVNEGPDTILFLASTRADIVHGIPSFRDTYHWIVATKLIVVYLSSSEDAGMMLIDPLVKEVFATLDRNFRIFSEFGKELTVEARGSEDNAMVGILSHEPYSFHSKDAGFTKGIEVELVKGLARWSHFGLELEAISESSFKQTNYDIIVGAPNQMKYGHAKSIDFQFDDLTWCVKRTDLHPPWRSFFLIATIDVWLVAIIGVYFTAATLYAFYSYYHHPENFHYCTGIAVLCLFSISVPYNPTHGIARVHFAILLIYGLLALISVNSFLITQLTKPPYQYQIHTVDELINEKYKILIDEELITLDHLGDDKVSCYVKQNYELCNAVMCMHQLLVRSNVATIVPRKYAEYFESHGNDLPTFCFTRSETFNRVARSLTVNQSKRHLLNRTNSFIRQAMETGHLLKWETVTAERQKNEDDSNTPVVLTVNHFLALVLIYIVCVTTSVLTFVGECLTYKNIQKGDAAGGLWKFLDKYVFSPERVNWQRRNQVPLNRV